MHVRSRIHPVVVAGLVGSLACAIGSMTACSGADTSDEAVEAAVPGTPAERLEPSWPVTFATDEAVGAYDKPGWVKLVVRRDIPGAVSAFGPSGGVAVARSHIEAAAVYRQAALLEANALIQTYGATPEVTDPVGTAHLLTVSYVLVGELDKARAESAKLGDVADPTQAWHGPWRTWLAGDAVWPPDLSGLPLNLGEPAPGGWPDLGTLPHYELPEQGESSGTRPMGDPGALVALALWHDRAAAIAAPDSAKALRGLVAGYELPVEADPADPGELTNEMLFGSDLMVSADAAFLAAVHGPQGAAAVDAFADRSLLALLAQQSRIDGKINAERAVDVLAVFRADLLRATEAKTNGEPRTHQREFADAVVAGSFRGLALVAEVEGDREVSGLLRINALDRSEKGAAWPPGLLALGAWDAKNRYPTRAQDILHAQAKRFPSLEAARYGLDVMALRVSRERPGETPGM